MLILVNGPNLNVNRLLTNYEQIVNNQGQRGKSFNCEQIVNTTNNY